MTRTHHPRQVWVDLADRNERLAAPHRYNPYWNMLRYGRHIGYEKKEGRDVFWIARLRTKAGKWRRHCVGRADDAEPADGIYVLNFDQACQAAASWFKHNTGRLEAVDPRPLLPMAGLIFEPIGDAYSVTRALVDYLEWRRLSARPSNFRIVVSLVNKHVVPQIGAMLVDEVGAKEIRRLIRNVIETPPRVKAYEKAVRVPLESLDSETLRKRRKTANTVISILKQAFLHAWEDKKTDNERPWRACRPLRNTHKPRMLHLSRAECRRLVGQCEGEFRNLVLGGLYTGCRVTELIDLQVQDVLRDGYGILVKPGKTMRSRFVFLPDEGMAFFLDLAANRPPQAPLLPSPTGERWKRQEYVGALKKASIASDMPDGMCFHVLRHTYASQLVQAGAPFLAVSEQLGHVDPITVMRTYAHLSPQIRESEVRQRFTQIDEFNAYRASLQSSELRALRESLHGQGRDTYAIIKDMTSRDMSFQ